MTEWINKIEVVTRQLRACVRLIFEEADPIIVHSVTSAAHQILRDLSPHHQGARSVVKPPGCNLELINTAANFFKHADRDPSGRINIGPLSELNSILLFDAIFMLQKISGNLPMEAKIFWSWYMVHHESDFVGSGLAIDSLLSSAQNMQGMSLKDMRQFLRFQQILNTDEALPPWAQLG